MNWDGSETKQTENKRDKEERDPHALALNPHFSLSEEKKIQPISQKPVLYGCLQRDNGLFDERHFQQKNWQLLKPVSGPKQRSYAPAALLLSYQSYQHYSYSMKPLISHLITALQRGTYEDRSYKGSRDDSLAKSTCSCRGHTSLPCIHMAGHTHVAPISEGQPTLLARHAGSSCAYM